MPLLPIDVVSAVFLEVQTATRRHSSHSCLVDSCRTPVGMLLAASRSHSPLTLTPHRLDLEDLTSARVVMLQPHGLSLDFGEGLMPDLASARAAMLRPHGLSLDFNEGLMADLTSARAAMMRSHASSPYFCMGCYVAATRPLA